MFNPAILSADVKAIATLRATDVGIHITNAETFMDGVFPADVVSASLYRLIGLYLSAHFAFLNEGQIKTDKVDVLSTTFNMESDLGLNSTTFGQQAIALDPTGTLANHNALTKKTESTLHKRKGSITIF